MSYRGGGGPPYRRSPGCVYVGNLPGDVKEREVEDLFYKFGRIRDIDVKRGRSFNGSSYAFVEFERVRDAEAAIKRRNGYNYYDYDLRVEFAGEKRGKERVSDAGVPPKRYHRSEFRVVVTNLPRGCRWQHLKDHMRKAGEVGYANVESGWGVVEYLREDDMRYALDKLDGTEMAAFDSKSTIKVKPDFDSFRGKRSRTRSKDRRRSISDDQSKERHSRRSRDRGRNRSRDRSDSSERPRSRSIDREKSRSIDRDPSRSIDRDRSCSYDRDRSRSSDANRSRSVENEKSITPPPKRSRSSNRDASRSISASPKRAHSPENAESPPRSRERSPSSPQEQASSPVNDKSRSRSREKSLSPIDKSRSRSRSSSERKSVTSARDRSRSPTRDSNS